MIINPSQAWSILHRHAETDVKSIRLSELRTHRDDANNNNNQTDGFVTVHNNSNSTTSSDGNNHEIIVDWSRNRVTLETIQHLLRLCTAMDIREKIYDLAWGKLAPGSSRLRHPPPTRHHQYNYNNNNNVVGGEYGGSNFMSVPSVSFANDLGYAPRSASIYQQSNTESQGEDDDDDDYDDERGGSMHLSLRAPANQGLMMRDPYDDDTKNTKNNSNGSNKKKHKNALDEIHNEWKRIQSLTESIRMGKVRGASNKPLVDILVISGGENNDSVVTHSLEFVYKALLQNEQGEMSTSSLISIKVEDNIGSTSGASTTKNTLLQSTADGVINMVKEGISTPFKKKSSQGNLRGGLVAPFQTKKTNRHVYRKRKLKVLSSTDPSAFNEVLTELCPATTMVITLDLEQEKEKECKAITSAIRDWLISDLLLETSSTTSGSKDSERSREAIVQRHMYLVTCNDVLKKSNANAFLLPRHSRVEAFSTFSAAGLLVSILLYLHCFANMRAQGPHNVYISHLYKCNSSLSRLSLGGILHPLSYQEHMIWIVTLLIPILDIIYPSYWLCLTFGMMNFCNQKEELSLQYWHLDRTLDLWHQLRIRLHLEVRRL